MNRLVGIFVLIALCTKLYSQEKICINESLKHSIESVHLNESRAHWVSLPYGYTDSISYPVVYVFDAEWRFDMTRNILFDLGANDLMQKAIVVGIPHVEVEKKRGKDLTFSISRNEYDGDVVDSTWYNSSNSGGGMDFYNYLTKELMVDVNKYYATNGHETLVGHSYGGYFGAYILSLDHPFEVLHIYDPSIWYSMGEVIERYKNTNYSKKTKIHLTYQPEPAFHKKKVEEFIKLLEANDAITLSTDFYENHTHNSLYLDSFYKGILKTNQ